MANSSAAEQSLKALTISELTQRRKIAVRRGYEEARKALDHELASRSSSAPRRQRKVYMPGPTSGSFTVHYIDEAE